MGIKIYLPFRGHFPVTFGFGATPNDKIIEQKFIEWGILGHHGIDYGLPEGTEVLSCDKGKVILSGINNDFGISVILKHTWGRSLYAHLKETKVMLGDSVRSGEIIGLSGKTGAAFGAHLHFGIKLNNSDSTNGYLGFVDPSVYFSNKLKGKNKD